MDPKTPPKQDPIQHKLLTIKKKKLRKFLQHISRQKEIQRQSHHLPTLQQVKLLTTAKHLPTFQQKQIRDDLIHHLNQ
jgi:hypothetical protein